MEAGILLNPPEPPKMRRPAPFALPLGLSVASVVAAFLGGAMWINSQLSSLRESVHSLSIRVSAIDASRFNAGDGLEIWKEIARQKETVVRNTAIIESAMERIRKLEK